MDTLPVNETAIESITNDQVLDSAKKETAEFLQISAHKQEGLKRKLPLRMGSTVSFNNAGFAVIEENGKGVGEISFKYESDLTGDSETAQGERVEETVHYLHAAENDGLTSGFIESRNLNLKTESLRALAVDHSFVEAQKARTLAFEGIDDLSHRLGLKKSQSPQTQEDIKKAIEIQVGRVSAGQYGGLPSLLSAGQSLKLIEIIESRTQEGSSEFRRLAGQKEDFVIAVKDLIQASEHPNNLIEGELSELQNRKIAAEQNIQNILFWQVESLLQKPENVAVLERVFAEAGVSIDSVSFRTQKLNETIETLSDGEAKQCLLNYLESSNVNANELLNASMVIPGAWSEIMSRISELDPDNAAANNEIVIGIKEDLVKTIASTEPKDMRDDPRNVLKILTQRPAKEAVAQSAVEANLIFLMDDFPSDTISRQKLLSNSVFVEQYLSATLNALKSGEFTPLGTNFDPAEFAKSPQVAERVAAESLGFSFNEPENTAFLQDLAAEADFRRTLGSSPDMLLKYANWQLDIQMIKDGYDLSKAPTPTEISAEISKAQAQSLEFIRLSQEISRHRHMMHILTEPIAKVIVAQKLGKDRDSIIFPDNMLGGYSALLRSDKFNSWVSELWGFVSKVKNDKLSGGEAMTQYFRAKTLSEQKAVVTKYLNQ